MSIKVSEHDVVTDEITVRELTAAEITERELQAGLAAQDKADQETLAAERARAKAALLNRLGITADEAALLLS